MNVLQLYLVGYFVLVIGATLAFWQVGVRARAALEETVAPGPSKGR
jgi:hypothetical protein